MKQTAIHLVFSVALTVTAAASAAAPKSIIHNPAAIGSNKVERLAMPEIGTRAGEFTVTFSVPCDTEYKPVEFAQVRAYNASIQKNMELTPVGGGAYTCNTNLPAGIYDFMLLAKHIDNGHADGSDHSVVVIHENVEVSKDMTVTLNPADATNHVKFVSYNRDGNLSKQSTVKIINDNYDLEVTEEGNVKSINMINMIMHTDYNMLDYTSVGSSYIIEPSEAYPYRHDGVGVYDFYVNDVSDKYEFRQVRQMLVQDNSYDIAIFSQNGVSENLIEVKNNSSDYSEIKADFAKTPVSETYIPWEGTNPYTLYIGATLLGGEIPGMFGGLASSDKNALKAWISAGKSTADNPLAVAYWTVWEYETETTRYGVVTPYCYLVAEGKSSYSLFPTGKYEYGEQFQKYGQYYAGHPAFAINASNPGTLFQEAAPFALMSFEEMYVGNGYNNMMLFEAEHFGQMGERRAVDNEFAENYIYYNGEEVLGGKDYVYEWPSEWASETHESGEYVFKTVNNNVKIEGIEGKCVAEMCFNTGNEDFTAPAFQIIQTRNKNGDLAIRFENAKDGELRLVGGDFIPMKSYYDDSEYYSTWFKASPATLKVEYAPRGTEDYREITLRSGDDDYTYWGFNDFYRVPLDEVSVPSDDKWYDLRLTLTDAAGNYQRQTLSPAFRIQKPESGIGRVNDDFSTRGIDVANGRISVTGMESPVIEIFDMAGRKVASVAADSMDTSTLTGIFVVRVSDARQTRVAKVSI